MSRNAALRRLALVAPMATIAFLASCAAPPPHDVNPEQDAAAALGLSGTITFRHIGPEGEPLNDPTPDPERLTLADAIERSIRSSAELQVALAEVRIALAEARQTRLLPNPILSFVIRWGPGKSQIETSLTQEVLRAIQTPRRASASDNRLRAAAARAVATALDVCATTQERYAIVQSSSARIPLLQDRATLLEQIERVARSRVALGEGSQGDLTTIAAERVSLEIELDRARSADRQARLSLSASIGQPGGLSVWSVDPWMPTDPGPGSEHAWIALALERRPELQAIRWELAALGDDASLANGAIWESTESGVDATRDDDWRVGPTITAPLPLFDTGVASRERAAAEIQKARHEHTRARREIVEEVRRAHALLQASLTNLRRVRETLIPLQESRRRLAEDAYRSGLSDITALYLAERDLNIAFADAKELEQEASLALIAFQRAIGGPGQMTASSNSSSLAAHTDPADDRSGAHQ